MEQIYFGHLQNASSPIVALEACRAILEDLTAMVPKGDICLSKSKNSYGLYIILSSLLHTLNQISEEVE